MTVETRNPKSTSKRILIVDDIAENLFMLEALLEEFGYSVESAINGKDALEKLHIEKFDLIISDILMPVMDGFTFCRTVKGDERLQKIPLVFYTSTYKDETAETLALKLGANRFVQKPIDPNKFLDIIRNLLNDLDKGRLTSDVTVVEDNEEKLKLYSECIVKKLEEKVLGLEKEITSHKLTQGKLKESEVKFRTVCTTANDAIIIEDNDGNISYWNKAAERIFGYSAEEIVGRQLQEIIIPDKLYKDYSRGFKVFLETGQGPGIGKTIELIAINKKRIEFPIELSLAGVNMHGKRHAIGIVRDITERKKIEEQLRISKKIASLGRLTAGVFHEILNPVNIISSHVQLLLMTAEKGSTAEEDLRSIQEEIERIVKISDGLLKYSRKAKHLVEKNDINSLLEKTMSIAENEMKLDDINFIRELEDKLPKITANSDELRQVFLNLLTNARDAMPDGGTITISTRRIQKGGNLFVSIRFMDSGCGIPKENLESAFDPFFTTKKEGRGTGLGLSTSFETIERYGGTMSIDSKEGEGATVIIDLPVNT
jgi:two-component system cell cycle sensor histidine kinase/response regulator CckA